MSKALGKSFQVRLSSSILRQRTGAPYTLLGSRLSVGGTLSMSYSPAVGLAAAVLFDHLSVERSGA